MDRVRRAIPLATWIVALGVGIVLFTALGSGPLAAPPLTDPSAWGAWAAGGDPVVASVAVLRLLALALAWYLVGVTSIGVIARLLRAAALVRAADALTVPAVRRLLQGALGLGLATAVAATAAAPAGTAPAPGPGHASAVVMMRRVDADGGSAHTAAMRRLDPEGGSEDSAGMRRLDTAATERMTPVDDVPATVRHEVASGEHLWAIAEQALARTLDRPATDDEVAAYWQRLVEHNRERLADPHNPDLVYPGQVFVLPDPTASA